MDKEECGQRVVGCWVEDEQGLDQDIEQEHPLSCSRSCSRSLLPGDAFVWEVNLRAPEKCTTVGEMVVCGTCSCEIDVRVEDVFVGVVEREVVKGKKMAMLQWSSRDNCPV